MTLKVTDVDDARLTELNIGVIDTGRAVMIIEYPPKPDGSDSTILYRAIHDEENTP